MCVVFDHYKVRMQSGKFLGTGCGASEPNTYKTYEQAFAAAWNGETVVGVRADGSTYDYEPKEY